MVTYKFKRTDPLKFILIFLGALTASWLLHCAINRSFLNAPIGGSEIEDSAYWIAMRFVTWIAVPVWTMQWLGHRDAEIMRCDWRRWREGWGLAFGACLIWVAVSLPIGALQSHLHWPTNIGSTIGYLCLLVPITEEWVFRGCFMGLVRQAESRLWVANLMVSLGFLSAHLIGWSFQGKLLTHLTSAMPASIVIVSLFLGVVRSLSKSIGPCSAVHAVNNFVAACLG